MNNLNTLHWPLITGMGALALVHPFLNITGLMDWIGRPFGPLLIIFLISLVWLAIVVTVRLRHPILTLFCTGLVYGAFAVVISAILSPLLTGQLSGPLSNPFALLGVFVTNGIWGGTVGLVAWTILQVTAPAKR
jgi:hypothetical protein